MPVALIRNGMGSQLDQFQNIAQEEFQYNLGRIFVYKTIRTQTFLEDVRNGNTTDLPKQVSMPFLIKFYRVLNFYSIKIDNFLGRFIVRGYETCYLYFGVKIEK